MTNIPSYELKQTMSLLEKQNKQLVQEHSIY
jgi:hypothetical protein